MHDTSGALGALYQSEKADASSISNVAMAMMGIAATYVIGAISLVDKYGTDSFPWIVVVLLPAPLWLVAAYHSLIALTGMCRSRSVQIIEGELFDLSGIPGGLRGAIGTMSGDQIMDIEHSKPAHRVATAFVYFGVAMSVIGYTLFAIVRSWEHLGSTARIVAPAFYAMALLIVAASWTVGLREVGRPVKATRCPTCSAWMAKPEGDVTTPPANSPIA